MRAARRWWHVLSLVALVGTGVSTVHAEPPPRPSRPQLRAAMQERRMLRARWRAELRRRARHVGGLTVFHQIRDPGHRAMWRKAIVDPTPGRRVLDAWIAAGTYPGLFTIADPAGWYDQAAAGRPIQIRLRDDVILFDADIPEHRAVLEAWLANERALRGPEPPNRFSAIRPHEGVASMAESAGIVGGPAYERFYREMGIAGVAHFDTYGRECIVILHASAIAEVRFPDPP